MNYIELDCRISPYDNVIAEIIIAELSELGFESFVENENGLFAYIPENTFKESLLSSISVLSNPEFKISFKNKSIEQENWNETWEKNYFEPIIIEGQCVIRSTFHKNFPEIEYQITIDPKMAFGTGHHETTSLMIKEILRLDFTDKKLLDMGCGTGILAILSAMRGCQDSMAIDIDEWSYENTKENIKLNSVEGIVVEHGNVSLIEGKNYDIIYANINKNVLLKDIPLYVNSLNIKGLLLLSGFYASDFEDIDAVCIDNGLKLKKRDEKNNWTMLKYYKT